MLALAAAAGTYLLVGEDSLPPPARSPAPPTESAGDLARSRIPLTDEAAILAADGEAFAIFRLAADPRVLVLEFPSLREQSAMLLRLAALLEVRGLPRERIVAPDEFAAALRTRGAEPDTFYYGHDYRASDLARFFALAAREGVALGPEEARLREIIAGEGWDAPGAVGALISFPAHGRGLDAAARATILRHELSHAAYFIDPLYAAHVARFWQDTLTEPERVAFRRFLAAQEYDPANEDLMMNEMQAHLVHTPDSRFFNAAAVGIPPARLDELRAAFVRTMPPGWLRDATEMHSVAPNPAMPVVLPAAGSR